MNSNTRISHEYKYKWVTGLSSSQGKEIPLLIKNPSMEAIKIVKTQSNIIEGYPIVRKNPILIRDKKRQCNRIKSQE